MYKPWMILIWSIPLLYTVTLLYPNSKSSPTPQFSQSLLTMTNSLKSRPSDEYRRLEINSNASETDPASSETTSNSPDTASNSSSFANDLSELTYINSLLIGYNRIGTWKDPTGDDGFSGSTTSSGLAFFSYSTETFSDDELDFALYIYDGMYIDQAFTMVSFEEYIPWFTSDEYSSETSTITLQDTGVFIYTGNNRAFDSFGEKCNVNATISFIDATTNTSFSPSYDIDLDQYKLAVQISVQSSQCSLNFVTSALVSDGINNFLQEGLYSLLMSIAAFIQAVVCYMLVKAAEAGDTSSKKVSLGTLRILNAFDFYLCLTNLNQLLTSTSLIGFTAAPYAILSLHYEFLLILHTIGVQMQMPAGDSEKLGSVNRIWLGYSLISVVCSVYLEMPEFIYIALAVAHLPQIIQNFILKRRVKLHFWILGPLTIPKVLFSYYMLTDEENVFRTTPNPTLFYVVMWLLIAQLVILFMQRRIVFGNKASDLYKFNEFIDEKVAGQETCSICLEDFSNTPTTAPNTPTPTSNPEEGKDKSLLAVSTDSAATTTSATKPALVVTPCNHLFHESCLRSWVKHKYECPCCRFNLPSMPGDDD